MLAYNLSPSFNWDTTGHERRADARASPRSSASSGFVFNFITYGGHQIDGLAGEEFAAALRQDGMLALARLQRKFRLLESPYRTPQTLVGGPRADAALMAHLGAHGDDEGDGQGLDAVPAPRCRPRCRRSCSRSGSTSGASATTSPGKLTVSLRPHTAGSRAARAARADAARREGRATSSSTTIQDRRGRNILSVRDQNTFDLAPAPEAPDDARAALPHPPLQGRRRCTTSRRPRTTTARPSA